MNIYDFFNSKDIAVHCQKIGYKPSPWEKAYIIGLSQYHTMAQKHNGWEDLLRSEPDSMRPDNWGEGKSLHTFLRHLIQIEQAFLKSFQEEQEGYIYNYSLLFPEAELYQRDSVFYSNYAACFAALQADLGEHTLGAGITRHKVYAKPCSQQERGETILFNSHLEVMRIDSWKLEEDWAIKEGFSNMCISIPTPFQPGDLVTSFWAERNQRSEFVLLQIPCWENTGKDCRNWSDMLTTVSQKDQNGNAVCEVGPNYLFLEFAHEPKQGGNAMSVFTYGFNNPHNHYVKIQEDTVQCDYAKITGITFKDYPLLRIDNLALENCVFENCHSVYLSDCKVNNCRFYGVETVYADDTTIDGCDFEHLRCDNDCVLCLEDAKVSFCNFKDVELTNEAYLVNGAGDVWIESCSFENIRTDRQDRELFFCEETVGKIFKKKVQFCIADTASCRGLDNIQCTVADKTPENPIGNLWIQAMERGINVDRAMEMMRDGVSWDERQWDAHTLGLVIGELIIKIPVYNCLTLAGLRTVGDLVRLDFEQILQIKHLGKFVVNEVVALLHSLGIEGSAWDYLV